MAVQAHASLPDIPVPRGMEAGPLLLLSEVEHKVIVSSLLVSAGQKRSQVSIHYVYTTDRENKTFSSSIG